MQKILVPITFTGTAEILVPDNLPPNAAQKLAQKLACARVLATFENADAPEADACDELAEELLALGIQTPETEAAWDASQATGLGGTWTTPNF